MNIKTILAVGVLSFSLNSHADINSNSMFYDDYLPLCTWLGGRMTKSIGGTAENVFKRCQCIDQYIEDKDIVHEGLRVDLAIGVFSNMEYYIIRDGLSTEEQFFHIAETIKNCSIE